MLIPVRWAAEVVVVEVCNLIKIGRWPELRVVIMCHLAEVTKDDDNKTSVELNAELLGALVGDSRSTMP